MKASEVLEIVQDYIKTHGPDAEVITSIDSEGNGYQPIDSFAFGFYQEGEFIGKNEIHECLGLEEDDKITKKKLKDNNTIPALCFWPG